jgi:hypothetical protein
MNYLVCSLYTLVSEDFVFNNLNLKYDTFDQVHYDSFFYKNRNSSSFFTLLNKEYMRFFTSILVIPFLYLKKDDSLNFILKEEKELLKQTSQLKKYLRKFHSNYNRYFFYENGGKRLTKKEINSIAIESLFLLTGI